MNAIHVYKAAKGWAVRKPGARGVIAYYPTRYAAIERGRSYLLKRGGGNLRIHRAGRIERSERIEENNNDG